MNDEASRPPHHEPWRARFERIARLADRLGRLPRRSDPGIDDADVSWIADQRRATTLTPEQQRALSALPGWVEATRSGAWYERAEELRQFIDTHHRLPTTRSTDAAERALAHWLSRQKVSATRGALSQERTEALDYALGRHPSS